MYLTSNCLFKIQLFIQHSNIHLAFNYSFNIQLFVQQSNFHSINYAGAPNTSSQLRAAWPVTNLAAAAASVAMRTAHKDDDTIIDFDVEFDLLRFLSSVLDNTDQVSHTKGDHEILEQHIVVVDQKVRFLRTLRDSSSNISADDEEYLDNLSSAFFDVSSALRQCLA